VSIAALGIVPIPVPAPVKPDFSGQWSIVADSAASRPAGPVLVPKGDMGSGWGATITITQNADRLTVTYPFFSPYDIQRPIELRFALDGSETRNALTMGWGTQVERARAVWRGDQLVITTTYTFSDPSTGRPTTGQVTRTLSLESPTSLLVESEIGGVLGGPPSTSRTVYRKH
jgi:hypothetical protein